MDGCVCADMENGPRRSALCIVCGRAAYRMPYVNEPEDGSSVTSVRAPT
jgi:hypothetical protein